MELQVILYVALYSIPFLGFAWWILVQATPILFPPISNKLICLLIAHPDDGAKFFSPTILALTAPHLNNQFEILCLCGGKDPALRERRKKKLYKSAAILGVRTSALVSVGNDDRFQDSMNLARDSDLVATVLSKVFVKTHNDSSREVCLDVLITFDGQGVSQSANHQLLYHGAINWLNGLGQIAEGASLYCLTTTNIFRKYISMFDAPITVALALLARTRPRIQGPPNQLVFLSNSSGHLKAHIAMTNRHISEILWFQYVWNGLSRYIGINDLKRKWPARG
ncbi:putative deacetylase LmbE-like domain-containing protein [Tricladium varicosporioides]|nr:putative deacetylase LmbE-like domain-containing protein [Hymenoscyphus varicosporioides]